MIVSTTEKFRADLIKWLNENVAFSQRIALDQLIPFEEAEEDVQERIIEIMNS